jgi:hypothetical protein
VKGPCNTAPRYRNCAASQSCPWSQAAASNNTVGRRGVGTDQMISEQPQFPLVFRSDPNYRMRRREGGSLSLGLSDLAIGSLCVAGWACAVGPSPRGGVFPHDGAAPGRDGAQVALGLPRRRREGLHEGYGDGGDGVGRVGGLPPRPSVHAPAGLAPSAPASMPPPTSTPSLYQKIYKSQEKLKIFNFDQIYTIKYRCL